MVFFAAGWRHEQNEANPVNHWAQAGRAIMDNSIGVAHNSEIEELGV